MSGSFESVRWNASVHRLDRSYSHPNEFLGNGVRTHLNSKGKIPSIWKILPRGVSNPQPRATQDRELNTLPMSYSCPEGIPHNRYILWWVTLSSRKCNHISLIAQKSTTHFLHPTCLLTHLKTSFEAVDRNRMSAYWISNLNDCITRHSVYLQQGRARIRTTATVCINQ